MNDTNRWKNHIISNTWPDLIESTKQFDSEHQRGKPDQNRFQSPACAKPMFIVGASNQLKRRDENDDDDDDYIDHLGPLGSDRKQRNVSDGHHLGRGRCLTASELDHFAFDNPYFRAECDLESAASQAGEHLEECDAPKNLHLKNIHANNVNQNSHSTTTTATNFTADSSLTSGSQQQQQERKQRRLSVGLLAVVGQQQSPLVCSISNNNRDENSSLGNTNNNHIARGSDASGLKSFIEHHISDLHSRQVTSSVKELTIHSG